MKPEICAKQRFFDPYAYLVRVPNNTLKQLHRVDKTTGKNGHTQIIDPEHGALAFTSLGHSGLQISLLSHIRDESEVSQRLGATDKILMLDVVIFSLNAWNPVYLRLISERRANLPQASCLVDWVHGGALLIIRRGRPHTSSTLQAYHLNDGQSRSLKSKLLHPIPDLPFVSHLVGNRARLSFPTYYLRTRRTF